MVEHSYTHLELIEIRGIGLRANEHNQQLAAAMEIACVVDSPYEFNGVRSTERQEDPFKLTFHGL